MLRAYPTFSPKIKGVRVLKSTVQSPSTNHMGAAAGQHDQPNCVPRPTRDQGGAQRNYLRIEKTFQVVIALVNER